MDNEVKLIVEKVLNSKAYTHLDPAWLETLVKKEVAKGKKPKEAEKDVKAFLHQIYGAFSKSANYEKIFSNLEETCRTGNAEDIRQALRQAMRAHASSAERVDMLENFYQKIFELTSKPSCIVDLASGLNPLSMIYLEWPKTTSYVAYDLGVRETNFLNQVFKLFGYTNAKAIERNVLLETPSDEADLALLLKAVTTFEAQEKGASRKLIESLRAKTVVVSFPTSNLGVVKKEKGMKEFYEKLFMSIVESTGWKIEKIDFGSELVFIIKK